jgi:hypothetical protein
MNIESAQYEADTFADPIVNSAVRATREGKEFLIPLDPANTHYAEILRQVEAGDLTIADAD